MDKSFPHLSELERKKYETAIELGLLDKLSRVGWAGLTAKESGQVGGKMGKKRKKIE